MICITYAGIPEEVPREITTGVNDEIPDGIAGWLPVVISNGAQMPQIEFLEEHRYDSLDESQKIFLKKSQKKLLEESWIEFLDYLWKILKRKKSRKKFLKQSRKELQKNMEYIPSGFFEKILDATSV